MTISKGSKVLKHMTDDFAQGGKNYIKRKDKRESPRADNFVFRLHYQFTFGILVSFGLCYYDAHGGKMARIKKFAF